MTALLPDTDADRHQLVLTAEGCRADRDSSAAAELAQLVREGAAFIPTDVLFSLSAVAIAACWPSAPRGGWAALDDACTMLLGLDVVRGAVPS